MSPFRRFSEINFYEELGVAPDASHEEIHDAFRALVRLLHPDQQTNIQLKEIAERQMRKLNPIYAVLSDPERRRRYDAELREGYVPAIIVNAPPLGEFRRPRRRFEWFAAALVGAAFLLWLVSRNASAPPVILHEDANTAAPATDAPPARPEVQQSAEAGAQERQSAGDARLRSDMKDAIARRDDALREFNRVGSIPAARPPFPAPPAVPKPLVPHIEAAVLPATPRLALQLAPPDSAPAVTAPDPAAPSPARVDAPVPQRTRLAGIWVYVKPPAGQNPALPNSGPVAYPPEYIQTSITEENGMVHGLYRSRFRISDRAISPDVNFTFTGATDGFTLVCPWIGSGGAKGRLTLRLTSENLLRVDWVTLVFGNVQGLASGSAILTRRTE